MDFGKTFRRWASYRKTVRELSVLDDRELNDLAFHAATFSLWHVSMLNASNALSTQQDLPNL